MKVVTWRVISIVITAIVTYSYTGDLLAASKLTAILHACLVSGHYLFETLWDKKMKVDYESR